MKQRPTSHPSEQETQRAAEPLAHGSPHLSKDKADISRRQFLVAGGVYGGAMLTGYGPAWGSPALSDNGESEGPSKLDALLAAHADALPENGGGANHYPMAAEALAALGQEDAVEDSWIRGAELYAGELPRVAPIDDATKALGSYERLGDFLDDFRDQLESNSWQSVVAHWAPQLAPGITAAAFHGIIRTAHAVRALRQQETAPRKDELAVGLAYWSSRYAKLPTTEPISEKSLQETLEGSTHPWLDDREVVGFHAVGDRLNQAETPVAPPPMLDKRHATPREELQGIVRDAAAGVLEMLVLERNRLWLMHTVTGPAAVDLLLPEVDEEGAQALVAYARQAVVAMFSAYGEPYTSRAHLRKSPPPWQTLIERAVATRSVHTIKLTEALRRFDTDNDPLWRSVAAQWLEWV